MSEHSTIVTDADLLEAGTRLLAARRRKAELSVSVDNMDKVIRQMRREVEEASRAVGAASAYYDAICKAKALQARPAI